MNVHSSYICINCGHEIENLCRKYSATVLKLSDCENCKNVADKYVEYDIVIIFIDLVLLQKEAYRHILFNSNFKNFWKLSVVLLLTETYSEWTQNFPNYYSKNQTDLQPNLQEVDMDMVDIQFYKICLNIAIKTACFYVVLFLFTTIYQEIGKSKRKLNFMMIWRTLTISSFGIFLLLPSLIWDTSVQEFHLSIVTLYTTLSQLIAYTVLTGCSKIWCLFAVFSAYYCKSFCIEFFDMLLHQIACC